MLYFNFTINQTASIYFPKKSNQVMSKFGFWVQQHSRQEFKPPGSFLEKKTIGIFSPVTNNSSATDY